MTDKQSERTTSRRKFIAASGAAGVAAIAGCSSGSGSDGDGNGDGNGGGGGDGGDGSDGGDTMTEGDGNSGGGDNSGNLTADGSSTVYPITSDAGSVWNSNPPADDGEYWGKNSEGSAPGYDKIDNPDDKPMATFFAQKFGFDEPYGVQVGLSHSGTGITKVMNGQVDIGDASAPVEAELDNPSDETLANFTDHVVARDGQPIVVSKEIYDAGVTKLTGEQVRKIYQDEITNWSEIPSYNGPDKKIQAVGRAEGSGTDTAFRVNLLGDANAPMPGTDVRKGQNQQVQTTLAQSDNAIAYMALAFVTPQVPAVALELDGTTYELGKNLGSPDYPLSRDLHCYTWKGTSAKEAAFIYAIMTEYGQKFFVAPNNYFMIPPKERKAAREKLLESAM